MGCPFVLVLLLVLVLDSAVTSTERFIYETLLICVVLSSPDHAVPYGTVFWNTFSRHFVLATIGQTRQGTRTPRPLRPARIQMRFL